MKQRKSVILLPEQSKQVTKNAEIAIPTKSAVITQPSAVKIPRIIQLPTTANTRVLPAQTITNNPPVTVTTNDIPTKTVNQIAATEDYKPVIVQPKGVPVKGLYMTGWIAGQPKQRSALISLIDRTELNAVVLDIKDDEGQLTGDDMGIELAKNIQAAYHKADLPKVLGILKEHNIYPIARIVCFKDSKLAAKRSDLAVKTADGQLWRDRRGMPWVDPYNQEVWRYVVDIAKASAQLGFKEIQFDYVRYVSDGNNATALYPNKNCSKEDNILAFLTYARKELSPLGVNISADVFGLTTSVPDDLNIGQKFEKVSSAVDFICPMVYPSHYYPGSYGYKNPNAFPYEIVLHSMKGAINKDRGAVIRPWLQDFSMGQPQYNASHVIAQKKAVYDAGLKEWILWNAGNKYHEDALIHDK